MTEKEKERKVKKAAEYSAKAAMDFMTSEGMKEVFTNVFAEIYAIAPDNILENIYGAVGTKKGYVKISKSICEDETYFNGITEILEANKLSIMEQFGIKMCDFNK